MILRRVIRRVGSGAGDCSQGLRREDVIREKIKRPKAGILSKPEV
jgi:hypothetical protein